MVYETQGLEILVIPNKGRSFKRLLVEEGVFQVPTRRHYDYKHETSAKGCESRLKAWNGDGLEDSIQSEGSMKF